MALAERRCQSARACGTSSVRCTRAVWSPWSMRRRSLRSSPLPEAKRRHADCSHSAWSPASDFAARAGDRARESCAAPAGRRRWRGGPDIIRRRQAVQARELRREAAIDPASSGTTGRIRELRARRLKHYQRSLALLAERLAESPLVQELRDELASLVRERTILALAP